MKSRVLLAWVQALLLCAATANVARAQDDPDLAFMVDQSTVAPNVMVLMDDSKSMQNVVWSDPNFVLTTFWDKIHGSGTSAWDCNNISGFAAVPNPSGVPVNYDGWGTAGSSGGYADISGTGSVSVRCFKAKGFTQGMCDKWKGAIGDPNTPSCAIGTASSCSVTSTVFSTNPCWIYKFPDLDTSAGNTYWTFNYMHFLLHQLHTSNYLIYADSTKNPKPKPATRSMAVKDAIQQVIDDPTVNPDDPTSANNPNCTGAGYTPYKERVRFGLARYRKTGIAHGLGSFVRVGIQDCNKKILKQEIAATDPAADTTPLKSAPIDVARYFLGSWEKLGTSTSGYTNYNLNNQGASSTSNCAATPVTNPTTTTCRPVSPIDKAYPCRQNFMVFLTDGHAGSECLDDTGSSGRGDTGISCPSTILSGDNALAMSSTNPFVKTFLGGSTTGATWYVGKETPGGNPGTLLLDKITGYMARTDLTPSLNDTSGNHMKTVIPTYIVGFTVDDPAMRTAAKAGDGQYYTVQDQEQLVDALTKAITEIRLRALSFASASVPTSISTQGNAYFRAYVEGAAAGRMYTGHLQAYAIGVHAQGDPNKLIVTGPPANCTQQVSDPNDPQTFFVLGGTPGVCTVATDAVTHQFKTSVPPFWDAQTVLHNASVWRNLYVNKGNGIWDPNNTALDPNAFTLSDPNDKGKYLLTDPNSTLPTIRTALIQYLRGKDSFDEDNDNDPNELRTGPILGDIFHSNLLTVGAPSLFLANEKGFGPITDANAFYLKNRKRNRVIYAGANDGFMHAFDAGKFYDPNTNIFGDEYYDFGSGKERFGYMPAFLLPRVREFGRPDLPKPTFMDGPPTVADVWVQSVTDPNTVGASYVKTPAEWRTVIVAGARNGGAGVLALDVTLPGLDGADPDMSVYPKLVWEFTHNELGLTWSKPIITRVKIKQGSGDFCGIDDGENPCLETWVAIFGGGYDTLGDPALNPNAPTGLSGGKSTGLYMVAIGKNGSTPKLIGYNKFTGGCSVASEPAVLDLNSDGFADLVYVGDLCGRLYKWDISKVGTLSPTVSTTDWPFGLFFKSPPGGSHQRSFFFPPSAAMMGNKLTLSIGTGERTNFAYKSGANDKNHFYVIQDLTPTGSGSIPTTPLDPNTNLTKINGSNDTGTPTSGNDRGFYFEADANEKFTGNSLSFGGKLIAGSFTPDPSSTTVSCSPKGTGRVYIFDLVTGAGAFTGTPDEARRFKIGTAIPLSPSVAISKDKATVIMQDTSGGLHTPNTMPYKEPLTDMLYWRNQQ